MFQITLHPMKFKSIRIASGTPVINAGEEGEIVLSSPQKFVVHIVDSEGHTDAIVTPGENPDFPQVARPPKRAGA